MNIQEATALGIIIGAISTPFVKLIISLFKKDGDECNNKNFTYKEFLNEKDSIYTDMDIKIEKATKQMATKESVENLKDDVTDIKKNVSEMQRDIREMSNNVAVLLSVVERRRVSRDDN